MRIGQLHLTAFGPFTDRVLDFGGLQQNMVFIHGPNEAGKSSTLRAIADLRFGIPMQSKDNFVHDHRAMRLGGVLHGADGRQYEVVRRKGRAGTLTFSDGKPVSADFEALMTAGLKRDDYEQMFGLDHQRLREGAEALLKGEGEIGAALFEASAGVRSIPRLLDKLDSTARNFYVARGSSGKINVALRQFNEHHASYKDALVRPTEWADLYKRQQQAKAALQALETCRNELHQRHKRVAELRAVAPLLRALDEAHQIIDELGATPELSDNAEAERVAAQAGLSAAHQHAQTARERVKNVDGAARGADARAVRTSGGRWHRATGIVGRLDRPAPSGTGQGREGDTGAGRDAGQARPAD